MKIKKIALMLAVMTSISACAPLKPMPNSKSTPRSESEAVSAAISMSKDWEVSPIFSEGKSSIVISAPYEIPSSIRNKKITLDLEPNVTVADVVAILGKKLDIPIIIADSEVAKKSFYMPRFEGTVGGFISAITRATDIWFTWEGSSIIVSATEKISVTIPQDSTFTEQMTKSLTSLGLAGKVDWHSGTAIMTVAPSEFRHVKHYLEKTTSNAAVISMQLAVINVTMNQNAKQGIDWENLAISAGSRSIPRTATTSSTGTTTGTGTTTVTNSNGTTSVINNSGSTGITAGSATGVTSSSSGTIPFASPKTAISNMYSTGKDSVLLDMAGSAIGGAVFSKYFNFVGLFNYLQTYGTTEARQNVLLKTFTGNKVALKSVTKIPYVAGVGVNNLSNTSINTGVSNVNNSNSLGAGVFGSTRTDNAEDGTDIEITPSYDSNANTVTIDLKVDIKSVIAFNELSAGNQIGTLTQPTTASREFTDKILLRPGSTAVVGGISFDNITDNRGGPIFLSSSNLKNLESQTLKVDRQTMFIVIRPTIMRLGKVLENSDGTPIVATDSLDLIK